MAVMQREDVIEKYVKEVQAQLNSGHAKEHAYRPALKDLMGSFEDCLAVNDPKRSDHGNPDFVFLKDSNRSIILGYAEAKDIDISLDKTEKTDQMHRYAGYDNLFLTNYIEFRFLKNGEKYKTISIGTLKNGQLELHPEAFEELQRELKDFLEQPPEKLRSGKRLAQIMGAKSRRIRDNVSAYLKNENDEKNGELEKMYKMMRKLLVHDLNTDKFADMYAQTLVYGLFVARYNDPDPDTFSRSEARDLVPASNPFLREFFDHIVGTRFDKRLAYIVDELCEVFRVSNVKDIVNKHLKIADDTEDEKDPIIHFYEDFLKEYDPIERKKMGAYYTPVPVVKFIVRQVDEILKNEFGLAKGLADNSKKPVTITSQGLKHKIDMHRVQILDPAVGTATFLNETIKHIHKSFKGQEGRWSSYAEYDLLPRLHGFELMMAPYTIAHLKLGMTLQQTGVKDIKQRLGVYLTNTLEEGEKDQVDLFTQFGLAEVVSKEADEAVKIKHERPIMVIIGNPPYSGESSNKTDYAGSLVQKYKFEPGGVHKLKERNPKWINDDYVKFIAFAEAMVAKNGDGIVAMITNHAYLDNPTFRGMRWQLAQTFNKIYILDLHGSTKKNETTKDGGKDENVFDIQQGVSIIIGVKTTGRRSSKLADVFCADIFGTRKFKFGQLGGEVKWNKIDLDKKMYFFTNKDNTGKTEYDKGIAINELFPVNSVGIVTSADKVLINQDKKKLLTIIAEVKLDDANSKINEKLKNHEIVDSFVESISYRPFDNRYIYYSPEVIERPREKIMRQFEKQNVGLMVCRQQKTDGFHHALVHSKMVESSYVSNKTSEIGYSFPLYLYDTDERISPNIQSQEALKLLEGVKFKIGNEIVFLKYRHQYQESPKTTYREDVYPVDIFDYAYCVLHSPKYRKNYKEFLKSDFPRIPRPKDGKLFWDMAKIGKELRELHLMTSQIISDYQTTYPIDGTNEVDNVRFEADRVWINETQYFGNVAEDVWNFNIGGYQPAQKWLKDRKGESLSNDEIEHYQKIIKVLSETKKLMVRIDEVSR